MFGFLNKKRVSNETVMIAISYFAFLHQML